MKVDPNLQSIANIQSDPVQNAKTSRAQEASSDTGTTQVDGQDTVQFSPKFAEVQNLTNKLQQLPDVRSDRVSALKQQIQQGTYKPDPSEVAGAILGDPLNQGGNK
ncbi:MAG: flagellar biosynthesis anti-sigma factor FlgM [Candidatus Acidiferrales bacterium]|jgi:negative regulator of flagellin synthesis FlgM